MKRAADVIISVLGLILVSPVMLVVAFVIRIRLGSPVFFRQIRPGLGGQRFEMIKFRTMADSIDSNGDLLPDVDRLTGFGRFLRSTSLDELPELWNVLCGKMSLVGPRPLLVEYLPLYSDRQARRHEVLPGITGLAQVKGRNALSWNEKFDLDVWYVDNKSVHLDLAILWWTFRSVLGREGVSAVGSVTMPPFGGD